MKMKSRPLNLLETAEWCKDVYDNCVIDDINLFGHSLLDLCADNIPDVPLSLLEDAIIVAGIYSSANERIKKEIANYCHERRRNER